MQIHQSQKQIRQIISIKKYFRKNSEWMICLFLGKLTLTGQTLPIQPMKLMDILQQRWENLAIEVLVFFQRYFLHFLYSAVCLQFRNVHREQNWTIPFEFFYSLAENHIITFLRIGLFWYLLQWPNLNCPFKNQWE